ncbi:glycosyltransferase family 4 protein [Chloroflexus sp.]|uniref:glycosyltransferase family 4 protein n=1 Tax=Chloroflexus sp. TaxID=1904827 RepID=UPI002633C70B|nr:glycosyltransferase family 4 protein [uncultured Chloroflexus sp.]
MHILHVVQLYWPAPSGAARYFQEIGARLAAEGHRVTVLATDAFDLEHLWMAGKRHIAEPIGSRDGVQIRRLAVRRLPGPSLIYPIIRRLMVEVGRIGRPGIPLLRRLATLTPQLPDLVATLADPALADVALVHTTNITLDFALIPVARWAQQRGTPHLCTPFVHLGEPGNEQVVRYYAMPHQIDLLRQANHVLTMTDLERAYLIRRGVPAEHITTVGAGVNPAEVTGGDGKRFCAIHNINEPVVLSLGVAAFDKGAVHTLDAMRRLWAQGSEAVWVQCGPAFGGFNAAVAALTPSEQARVRILGYIDNATRRDALAAAAVYVQPSRTDSFGITYLEAWCNGVPVIGARAGGVPAVIRHGTDGLLVPFGDVPAIAAAIDRLLRDRALAQAMGAAGQARALRELTWDAVYRRIRPLYDEVAAERRRF